MASRVQLLHLPTEILIGILAAVPSRASLANLARTCRRLQTLVEPYLYRSVYLGNHDGESFTYAIDRKAVRAEYIQELVIHYHYIDDIPNEDEYYPILVESLVPTISRLVSLRRLVVKGLEYDTQRSYDEPEFGPGPRLDALSMIWSWLFQRSAQSMSGILPSLTTCELIMNDLTRTPLQHTASDVWCFSSRETVLLHPKLQKLSIVAALIYYLDPETLSYTKKPWFSPTSLETLTLLCCDVSSHGLHDMLKFPKALKNFTLKGSPWTSLPNHFPIDRGAIVNALKAQAHSLLNLELDFYLHTNCPALDLRDFTSLEQLTIDPKVLRGDDDDDDDDAGQSPEALRQYCHLPPSLRSLRFREYRERGRPDLQTLSIVLDWVMSGGLPNLKNIMIQSATFTSAAILDAITSDGKSFRQAFRAVGVELAVERVRSCLDNEHLTIDCNCCSFCWRFLDQWDN
ncbi:hypothetical protein BDV32DRAFT_160849 [Aspergillus pseudonomiae]|uniref:Uncharacterized protein n=1 Tax=Aspergillus pseudonomiae TaxID=1506151 RepID=A0A5N6HRE5_9EURO|nr:uncharacterized protein BDV37DRAFT_274412 [Aspergillus pseudonomiae]KAB8256955.1 hypothetical protein BDV32DRAFT_160849 [Aspergillus pseudonomiae]KAE8400448.1 hypothetical protein BDV37DRAFT_274412 [Aspergillus pseudonomiae]